MAFNINSTCDSQIKTLKLINEILFLEWMDNFTYKYRLSLKRFGRYANICISDTITESAFFFNQFSTTEIVVQNRANYLDLALPSQKHTEWKRSANRFLYRILPFWSKEYFIAEKIPPNLKVDSILDSIAVKGVDVQTGYAGNLHMFIETLFHRFEKKALHKISEKDVDQKILILQRYLRCYKRFSVDRYHIAFSYILNLCLDPPLQSELTIEVLRTFCITDFRQISLIGYVSNAQCLENLILHAKDVRFNFWGLWGGGGEGPVYDGSFVPYLRALKDNPEFLKILLKYGFKCRISYEQDRFRCHHLHLMKCGERQIIESIDIFTQVPPERRLRMMLIMHIFRTFGDFGRAEDMLEILKYLIRSLPLPYVTATEFYTTMLQAVIVEFLKDLQIIVFKYSHADIFEDDIRISMPRRLKHLCRVAVRDALTDNFMIPDGIHRLKISDQLKAYLELEI